jgi:uncharacterized protein YqhQ
MPTPLSQVGGQAVLEGVLIRSPGSFAVAVRRATGEIVVREHPWRSWLDRNALFRLPVLRGAVVLVEGVLAGVEGLSFAAEQAGAHGPLAPAAVGSVGGCHRQAKSWLSTLMSFGLALAFGVLLFVALPHALAVVVGRLAGGLAMQSVAFQMVTGGCKLVVFFLYLLLIGRLPEVRRLFMYHGAEHKVIAAFEAGDVLDVAHAQRHTTFHARCGTSFLLLLVLLAMASFALLFPLLPALGEGWQAHVVAVALKIPLMLPLGGLAYEFNRWASTCMHRPWVRMLTAPGRWLQSLTVVEPTDDMVEVALVALKASLSRSRKAVVVSAPDPRFSYQKFADVCARQV